MDVKGKKVSIYIVIVIHRIVIHKLEIVNQEATLRINTVEPAGLYTPYEGLN